MPGAALNLPLSHPGAMSIEERHAWDMYFASVMAMQYHPGRKENFLSIEECAAVADAMIVKRRQNRCL